MPELSPAPSPLLAAGQPRVKGILWKKGGGRSLFGKKNWKKRYCVIINDNFYYYEDRQTYVKSQKYLKKPYRLQDCDVSVMNSPKVEKRKGKPPRKKSDNRGAFYFVIQPRDSEMRALHLRAETLAERDDWVRNIREIEADNSDLGTPSIRKESLPSSLSSDDDSAVSRRSSSLVRLKTRADELFFASQNLQQHDELRKNGKISTVIDLLEVLWV